MDWELDHGQLIVLVEDEHGAVTCLVRPDELSSCGTSAAAAEQCEREADQREPCDARAILGTLEHVRAPATEGHDAESMRDNARLE
jgi:hypothetical protein